MKTSGTSFISTPKGGGALSGMGEKFSPDLFTGTGNFSVPIALPSGRNGFQPELSLGYSTGNGSSVFGLGWSLSVPGIARKTNKGIPIYNDDEDTFILSGAEDLVAIKREDIIDSSGKTGTKTNYAPRTEGLFARIVHVVDRNMGNYWEVRSKDGLVSYYGTKASSLNDPCVIAKPDNREKIFGWRLSKTVDPFGNIILYSYTRELVTSGIHIYDQLYFDTIKYVDYDNAGTPDFLVQVKFNYADRPDAFSEYRQGFEVRTTKRCSSIEIYTNTSSLVKTKTYHFTFLDEISTDLPLNKISVLSRVQAEGHDNSLNEFLPPLEFKYSAFNPQKRDFYPVDGKNLPSRSLGNPDLELVDLTGNGLPDILQMNGVVRYWSNLGNGKFDLPRMMDSAPSLQLGDPNVQMIDANGDGKVDLFVNTGTLTGYFPTRFSGMFDKKSFHPYETAPSFSFHDPEVKLIDLDGDGITDVLKNGSRFECFFNDRHAGFNKVRFINKEQIDGFPNISFADPRIRLADMTGDGLQDIVLIHNGHIEYWPNLGYGTWGKKVSMKNCPGYPFGFDPKRILIGDVDGDGTSDVVYVENNKVTLWINNSGNAWSNSIEIQGTPSVSDMDALRITDLLGSGVGGILWSSDLGSNQNGQMFFLDFTAGNKPYLLEEMNNNMGSITKVEYTSSTKFYLDDFKNANTRWKTDLPFPVLVVSKVEVIDAISGGKLTTEYSYHHGYWDGGEREFRGFGRVDHRDTETFDRFNAEGLHANVSFNAIDLVHYSPPVETRTWFHLGPVGDEFGDWYETDFSSEYWTGDPQVLERPQSVKDFLKNLPRRNKRDALRTFRGTVLRTELYALDTTALQDKPYTVTESVFGIREEQPVVSRPSELVNKEGNFTPIFFPFSLAQRTTQWERGNDPMTQFSFSNDYDNYGQSLKQASVAVPRGKDFRISNVVITDKYLATYSKTEFIYKDIAEGQYMVNRAAQVKSYDASARAVIDVFSFAKNIFDETATLSLIGHSLNFYDGNAFTGATFGTIGDYGALVKSETLILPDAIITDAYGINTPLVLKDNPAWTADYPSEFQSFFISRSGYKYYGTTPYTQGYYTETTKNKYDFHLNVSTAKGLLVETKDPFDNVTLIDYDIYNLLPLQVTDALGMETFADYDYRVLQPKMITDPNENRVAFGFSPLGLMKESAVLGKENEGEGDIISESPFEYDASTKLEYDFFNFVNNADPVWVKTTKREFHVTDPDDTGETIVSVEYSDGLGRLLQTRTQAEDVLYGSNVFGDSGLPGDQNAANQDAIGIERAANDPLNVVVSGWQVYSNKGKVVEKFEPFFDPGFDFIPPTLTQTGEKIKMFYDPRSQLIRTLNPDGSEQTVFFGIPVNISDPPDSSLETGKLIHTPWESYTYDANDNAGRRVSGPGGTDISHFNTPKSSLVNAIGHIIKTTDRLSTGSADDIVMQYEFDIRGNLLKVTDALGRIAFEHIYDLKPKAGENDSGANVLWTNHIDGGEKAIVYDAAFRPVEMNDAKGGFVLHCYDELHRPIRLWAKDNGSETVTVRQYLIYGDSAGLANPENDNLKGKLYQHYDEAGLTQANSYDFKGNLLEKFRQVISDTELLNVFNGPPVNWQVNCYRVDWTGLNTAILDSIQHTPQTEYDGLNRVKKITYPADANSNNKELIPTYNKAGALRKVTFDGTDYVTEIAYNAKGQRLLIAYGNTQMTRYVYDRKTFRLLRMKTEKYLVTGNTYFPQSGNTRQDLAYEYDLSGNIIKITDRTPDCGLSTGDPDQLLREFDYDALYRLLIATGRESQQQSSSLLNDDVLADVPPVADVSIVRAYRQQYDYDKMGNILSLQNIASGNNYTRTFNYNTGSNTLDSIDIGANNYDFDFDANGNMISENTTRNYEWDYGDKMRSFYIQAGTSEPTVYAQYLYDASGNRTKKIVRTQGGDYLSVTYIDGIIEFHHKVSGANTYDKSYSYVMDDKKIIGEIREVNGTPFPGDISDDIVYHIDDHLGSCSVRLDATNGGEIDREEYYPFGESSMRTFTYKRYRFCGKEKDEESGLYNYGARYYAPWTCRFISVDPLAGKYPFYTPYQYAGNKPINFIDLDGKEESAPPVSNTTVSSSTQISPPDSSGNVTSTYMEQTIIEKNGQTITHQCYETNTYNKSGELIESHQGERSYSSQAPEQPQLQDKGSSNKEFPGGSIGGSSMGSSGTSLYENSVREGYTDRIKANSESYAKKVENAGSVEEAKKTAGEAVETRNQERSAARKKLLPSGKAISKALDKTPNLESLEKKYGPGSEKNLSGKELYKEIAKASGRSNKILSVFTKISKVVGKIGVAVGIVLGIIHLATDPTLGTLGQETGGMVGGILGYTLGSALAVIAVTAVAAALGVVAAPVVVLAAAVIGGLAGAYFVGKALGKLGRKLFTWNF